MIQEKIRKVWERIEKAANRVCRKKDEITLVAVTKGVPTEKIAEAVRYGIQEIGESKVQESQDKFQTLHASFPRLKWHMIGNLQRNKVNRAVEIFDCIQSVNSERLVEAINRRAEQIEKVQSCLVEVKVSEEPSKLGFTPDALEKMLDFSSRLKNVRIEGLMALAPYFQEPEKTRPYFEKAKKLFDRFFSRRSQPVLSMGISSDFEIAIEEGSNMVRIGTAIFGERVLNAPLLRKVER